MKELTREPEIHVRWGESLDRGPGRLRVAELSNTKISLVMDVKFSALREREMFIGRSGFD